MKVDVTYDSPTPQPDVTGCELTSVAIDPGNAMWSGVCMRTVASGAKTSWPVVDVPLTLAEMTSIADILLGAAQRAGKVKAGPITVTP